MCSGGAIGGGASVRCRGESHTNAWQTLHFAHQAQLRRLPAPALGGVCGGAFRGVCVGWGLRGTALGQVGVVIRSG